MYSPLGEESMSFDEVVSCHTPVDWIKSVSARPKSSLSVNAQVGEHRNKRLNQLNRLWPKTARGPDTKYRETLPDCLREWDKTIGIHAETLSHAFVEQNAMDHAFVVAKTLNNFLRVVADLLQRVLADLKDDLDLLTRSMNAVCDFAGFRPNHVELQSMDADATIGNRHRKTFPEVGVVVIVRVV